MHDQFSKDVPVPTKPWVQHILPPPLFQFIVTGKPDHRDNWCVPESPCGSAPKVPAKPEPHSNWRMKLGSPHPLQYYTGGMVSGGLSVTTCSEKLPAVSTWTAGSYTILPVGTKASI